MPNLANSGNFLSMLTGPSFQYSNWINKPSDLGMGQGASPDDISDDIGGLLAYLTILLEGGGEAQKDTPGCAGGATGEEAEQNCKGLGVQAPGATVAQVTDIDTNKKVPRSIYYNYRPNPDGLLGAGLMGLIPGMVDVFLQLKPSQFFGAISGPSYPPGMYLVVPDDASGNNGGKSSGYFSCEDILDMRESTLAVAAEYTGTSVSDIKSRCKEAVSKAGSNTGPELFTNQYAEINESNKDKSKMPDDPYIKLYYTAVSLLGLYILIRYFYPKLS